mmetsp:Transcript_11326/g.32031  ORF Transcript_11326/g.32031 Transcript_11326/m.32031 type:complete len:574 (+) Transcript_11326:93-1814(+)
MCRTAFNPRLKGLIIQLRMAALASNMKRGDRMLGDSNKQCFIVGAVSFIVTLVRNLHPEFSLVAAIIVRDVAIGRVIFVIISVIISVTLLRGRSLHVVIVGITIVRAHNLSLPFSRLALPPTFLPTKHGIDRLLLPGGNDGRSTQGMRTIPDHAGGMELAGTIISHQIDSEFFGILRSLLGYLASLALVMTRYHLDLVTDLQRYVAQRRFVTGQTQPIALLLDDAHIIMLVPHADDTRSIIAAIIAVIGILVHVHIRHNTLLLLVGFVDTYAIRWGSEELDSIFGRNAIQPSLGRHIFISPIAILIGAKAYNSRFDRPENSPLGLEESFDGGRLTRLLHVQALEGPINLLVAAGGGEAQIFQDGAVEERDDLPGQLILVVLFRIVIVDCHNGSFVFVGAILCVVIAITTAQRHILESIALPIVGCSNLLLIVVVFTRICVIISVVIAIAVAVTVTANVIVRLGRGGRRPRPNLGRLGQRQMLPSDAGAGNDRVALVPEAVQTLVVDEAPLHIAGLLEAISDVVVLLVTLRPLFFRNVHQSHQPSRLVVPVRQPDGRCRPTPERNCTCSLRTRP